MISYLTLLKAKRLLGFTFTLEVLDSPHVYDKLAFASLWFKIYLTHGMQSRWQTVIYSIWMNKVIVT